MGLALKKEYTLETRNNLITEYHGLVRVIVGKLIASFSFPTSMRDELESAGYIGLVEAADRFDSQSGAHFVGYAKLRIRGSIIDSIRSNATLSGKNYKLAKALQAIQELREDAPMDNLEDVLEFAAAGALSFQLSLSSGEVLEDELPADEDTPHEILSRAQEQAKLKRAVEALPEKERAVVEAYYFQGKRFNELSREDIGLTKSWVSRLHARALHMLRENLLLEEEEI